MVQQPHEVPLGDVEIAQRIAAATRGGRPVDRTPTLEQLLAAFGESEATPRARLRVLSALGVAGVRVAPDLLTAPPGSRLTLDAAGTGRRLGPALAGLLVLAVLIGGVAVAAVLVGNGGGQRVSDLPPTTALTTGPATTTTGTTAPTATATTPAATQTTTVGTVTTAPATTATGTTPTTRKRSSAKKRSSRKRGAAKRRTTVRARLVASQPTYLCVKDGTGRTLFGGTLSGARTFRAKVLRLNVGLGPTTRLTADGKVVPLPGSPSGVELRPGGRSTVLGAGQRPEC